MFRVIVLATLIIVAAFFASGPHSGPGEPEPQLQAYSSTGKEKPQKSFWKKTTDDPVAAFTAALVLFTAVLAVVSIVQIYFLTRADSIATESNRITRELFVSENRPWLDIEVTSWSGFIWEEAGVRFSIDIIITNSGKSPATNVWFEAVAFANSKDAENIREYCIRRAAGREKIQDNGNMVVPGNSYKTGFNCIIFINDINDNIIIEPDWFAPVIKMCVCYNTQVDIGTKYTGRNYVCSEISNGCVSKAMRISRGNLNAAEVSLYPGSVVAS